MKSSNIGGQAVIEGVMMKFSNEYAVAVRKPDGEIAVEHKKCVSIKDKTLLARIPILRGIFMFIESLMLGMKTLNFSAAFFEEDSSGDNKKESIIMVVVMILSIFMAMGIFVLLPYYLSSLLKRWIASAILLGLIEGVIRVLLFVSYVKVISMMEDIKRVFMYHGAEHKTINCIENGLPLTIENVKTQSKEHKRCGTSFMLFVMVISILVFLLISTDQIVLRMLFRILLVPVIAGISYELIRFAGNHDNIFVNIIAKPGLWLQALTTKEPDDDMIEVAITSVKAVYGEEVVVEKPDTKEHFQKVAEDETDFQMELIEGLDELENDIMKFAEDDDDDAIMKALDRYFES